MTIESSYTVLNTNYVNECLQSVFYGIQNSFFSKVCVQYFWISNNSSGLFS